MSVVAEFESLDQAKQVERMAEFQIVERLRDHGFDRSSQEWHLLAGALAEYGYAVLVAWGLTGVLPRYAAAVTGRTARRVPERLRLEEDDARALAAEIVMVALERFRSRSLERWSPDGGASLKTYFVGRCLMELPDVYEAWDRRERRPHRHEVVVDDGRHTPRPDEVAEARVLADQLLDREPVVRRVLELQAEGYTLDEIAASLGTSSAGVRSRIYRFRRQRSEEGFDA